MHLCSRLNDPPQICHDVVQVRIVCVRDLRDNITIYVSIHIYISIYIYILRRHFSSPVFLFYPHFFFFFFLDERKKERLNLKEERHDQYPVVFFSRDRVQQRVEATLYVPHL